MARGGAAPLKVRAPRLVASYWAEMASASARGGEWTGLLIYACRRLLECGYGVRDFLELVTRGPVPFEFYAVYCVLPKALWLLERAKQLELLVHASDESDVDGVFGGREISVYKNWRLYLLHDAARARVHYATFLARRQRLRQWSDAFMQRPRVQAEIFTRAAASLRGLVVVRAEFESDLDFLAAALRNRRELRHFERLALSVGHDASNAAVASGVKRQLGRVHPRVLLRRTRIGHIDGVVERVLRFHAVDDVLAVLHRDLVGAVRWPAGAKILYMDPQNEKGDEAGAYQCSAEGALD